MKFHKFLTLEEMNGEEIGERQSKQGIKCKKEKEKKSHLLRLQALKLKKKKNKYLLILLCFGSKFGHFNYLLSVKYFKTHWLCCFPKKGTT